MSGVRVLAWPAAPDAGIGERDFAQLVVDLARWLGWRVQWTWNSQHSPSGWPDLVFARPPRIIFVELKTERGRPSEEQMVWLATLHGCGLDARIWRPSDWGRVCEELQ